MAKKFLKNLYPFIFGLFPVLSLYVQNMFQVQFFRSIRTIVMVLVVTGLVYLLLILLYKDPFHRRIFTALLVTVLLNYGIVYSFLSTHLIGEINLGRARYLIPILIILVTFVLIIFRKTDKKLLSLDSFLSFISIALIAILLLNFLSMNLNNIRAKSANLSDSNLNLGTEFENKPNIYQIILDGYTNSEVLRKDFGYDNSEFEDQLKQMGFVTPSESCSNYDNTYSSLSSELNLDWVQNMIDPDVKDPNRLDIIDRLVNNDVRKSLENQGYITIAYENEFRWALWTNADFYLSPRDLDLFTNSINSFESIFLHNTIFRLAINYDKLILNDVFTNYDKVNLDKYTEQSFIIDSLSDVTKYDSPKFVFVHTTFTHVPFVFDENGSILDSTYQGSNESDFSNEEIREGYITSIKYANAQLIPILQSIISDDPDSIIILQGDHGYPGEYRHAIFFSIYDKKQSINPNEPFSLINLYREIFNHWFGGNYEALNDDLYQTLTGDYYQYQNLGTCQDLFKSDQE